jgi:LacI family transcriptional regulator
MFSAQIPYYMKTIENIILGQLREWRPDGIILHATTKKVVEAVLTSGIPAIAKGTHEPIPGIANIISDNAAAARIAAEHLLDRGLRHFGYCGLPDIPWDIERLTNFKKRINEAGFETSTYSRPKKRRKKSKLPHKDELELIADWLTPLPKPVGILACDDDRGQNVLEACRIVDLHAPEQVAVLGVDNDEIICELTNPPLSSVARNFEKAGYEAGELLDRLMKGEKMGDQQVIVSATHVEARQSTDLLAVEDPDIAQTLIFIRQHSNEPIQVSDILEAVAVSRRNLELRFQKILGRSIHKEINRVRIGEITKLLIETDMPIARIAIKANYSCREHMARFFRSETGMAMAEYRRKFGKIL